MSLRLFNTLSRSVEDFTPIEAGHVRLYTCGPTVYNFAHIGNFRAYIFEDLLRRCLKFAGFRVTHVMNLTDVDDKTIAGCRREKKPLKEFTQPYTDAFFADLQTLNIERAEVYPAATDHVAEMIVLIQQLMKKGFAYRSEDGSVYFAIDKFPAYGRLARLDKSGLRPGARVAQDEYEKENLGDFALWKAWDEKDGDVAWESPWGRGRPGWHIECSAMSMKYLGESFDIHTGGIDNMFPHHEDEIAQSEAATGKKFVNVWLHCAHLVVDGKKMSKSLGNFYTLRDLIERGFGGREIRYELIRTHYRQSLNFTFDGLDGARTALLRLDEFRARLAEAAGSSQPGSLLPWADAAQRKFTGSLNDDLNISESLAAVFDMVRDGNRALNESAVSAAEAAAALRWWNEMDRVLGFLQPPATQTDADIEELLEKRKTARASKEWKESDRLRDELAKRGWVVQDTAQGQKVRRSG